MSDARRSPRTKSKVSTHVPDVQPPVPGDLSDKPETAEVAVSAEPGPSAANAKSNPSSSNGGHVSNASDDVTLEMEQQASAESVEAQCNATPDSESADNIFSELMTGDDMSTRDDVDSSGVVDHTGDDDTSAVVIQTTTTTTVITETVVATEVGQAADGFVDPVEEQSALQSAGDFLTEIENAVEEAVTGGEEDELEGSNEVAEPPTKKVRRV
ncbi:hypothetical protein HDU93_000747 [Gonapodya sp. JEL0774]|nr:hypothetical protein HDU93_000747 [Gonapodya sp. JEL0774]